MNDHEGLRPPSLARLLAVGLAAAMVAEAVQMRFLWAADTPVYRGFLLSQLATVVPFHLLAALLLGRWLRQRAFAAAVFLAPVVFPSALIVYRSTGDEGVATLAVAGGAVFLAWSLLGRLGSGAPLATAFLGGVAGCLLADYRAESFSGRSVETADALRLGAICGVALVLALASARLPERVRLPGIPGALALAVLAGAVAVWPGRFGDVVAYPAPGPGTVTDRPPVVFIVLDTARARNLQLYGYERDTMPNLGRFAREEAVVFDRAVSNGAWSPPTHASFFTGVYPPRHGMHYPFLEDPDPPHHYDLDESLPTLAKLLGDAGVWSIGIASNYSLLKEGGIRRDFDVYDGDPDPTYVLNDRSAWHLPIFARSPLAGLMARVNSWPPFDCCDFFSPISYRRADRVTDLALAALDSVGDRSFFLFLNYYDPHQPYRPPHRCIDRFPGRQARRGMREIPRKAWTEVREGWREITPKEHGHYQALYDGELSCMDEELERLLDALRAHPRWDEMLVIVTADHGEALGEHGGFGHGGSLYDEQIRVPFVAKPGRDTPGAPQPGTRQPGPIMSVDVFPTVLEHVGVPVPEGIDGRAWGRGHDRTYAWLYWREPWDRVEAPGRPFHRELYTVEQDGWKLIVSSKGTRELYDLSADPDETRNLADAEPERRDALMAILPSRGSFEDMAGRERREMSPEVERQLRTLGYLE